MSVTKKRARESFAIVGHYVDTEIKALLGATTAEYAEWAHEVQGELKLLEDFFNLSIIKARQSAIEKGDNGRGAAK
jgi:hypothetical protein